MAAGFGKFNKALAGGAQMTQLLPVLPALHTRDKFRRAQYLNGFDVLTSQPDQDKLIVYCINIVAELLERAPDQIDPNAKFSRIGFDSAMSVQLIVSLEEFLDRELSPDLIHTFPTISSLSAHLAGLKGHPQSE